MGGLPRFIPAFVLVIACFSAAGESCARELRFLAAVGGDFGQGENRTPALSNGLTASANEGLGWKLGLEIPNNEAQSFVTQVYLGKKTTSPNIFSRAFFDEDTEFDRIVFEVVELFRISNHFRTGGGLAYHTNAEVSCQGGSCGSAPAIGIDNALGGIVQGGYFGKVIELSLRYTFIDYRYNGQKFDGSGAGLVLGFRF